MKYPVHSLLSDSNLDRLLFSNDGRKVSIYFLNMVDGSPIAHLITEGVVIFNYHNTFEEEDALPAYIGEVTCQEMVGEELESSLVRLRYGFLAEGGKTFIPNARCFHVHIEGGELTIDIICTGYRFSVNGPQKPG